jgi:2-phospho-L-lactate guanylyltransferase
MTVIIPAKPFNQAKTRLADALSGPQRAGLAKNLLRRTVRLAGTVGAVVVISTDSAVRRQAKQLGAWALVEAEPGLNSAVRQALTWVAANGERMALVIPADLPLLTQADLREMIRLGQQSPGVVIAPCHRGDGTNALLLSPPDVIAPAFGPNSFSRHAAAARRAGIEPVIYQSPTISFDLDLPADLAALRRRDALHHLPTKK